MVNSYRYWMLAAYKSNEPEVAQDELPADALRREIRKLGRRWERQFAKAAPRMAEFFQQSVSERSDLVLKKLLREAGISVKFRNTPATRDVIAAGFNENVSLIKSIQAKFHTDIEGMVMRSVAAGRDIGTLAKDLERTYGVTSRRAAFIARDQNNKATAMITKARQQELGITEAIWVHSAGGKEPRPNHVKFGREQKRYDVAKGMWDPDADGKGKGRFIHPGELINCRCVSKPVIPGF